VTACSHSMKADEASKLAHQKSVHRLKSVAVAAK
jgi:hypothetical protein